MGFRVSVQIKPESNIEVIDYADELAIGVWLDESKKKEFVVVAGIMASGAHKFREVIEDTGQVKFIIEQGHSEADVLNNADPDGEDV